MTVEKTPDINPIYVGLERSCPRDTKNVSYVVCWFRTCVDLLRLDFELWVVGWGGLSKNIGLTIVKSKDCTWDFWTTHTYEKCIILSNIITR